MSQPCLRNMSCKCPLCMGEDVSALLAITKTITSNITYTEPGEEDAAPPPTAKSGFMANSPPAKPAPAPRQSLKSRMSKPAAAPVEKLPPLDFQDVDMSSSAVLETAPLSTLHPPVEENQAPLPPPISSGGEAPPEYAGDDDASSRRAASSDDAPLQMEQLEAKVADKNWKVRKEVYDDLKAAFECGRAIEGGNVTELFGKFVDDSNAAAMECGLAAVLAYTVQASAHQWNNAIVGRVMPKVIDKGFSGRPGTVKLAEELVLEFVHLGSAEDTITALLEGTKNKKPKVPPLCVNSILECFKAFGPRVVPVVAVKKELKALCESTVNNVRPTALKLIGELYRWTGPTLVQDIVASLRPAQQTEYEAMIHEITPGQAVPTRYLKGKEPKPASATATKAGGGKGAATAKTDGGGFDPREFAETVNLLDRLPKTEYKAKMALPKWSEKVEALKIILDTIGSVPKLANGDYSDLVQTLKLCTQDSNVNIVAKSIEVLGVLADGLRRNFSQYARILLPVLLRKLSDKKSNVLAATHQALDMFQQHALPIDNMMDELKVTIEGATNKVPASRAQGVLFVERCISKQTVNVADAALMKTCGELFANCIEDPDPALRKAGVDAMVTLVKSSSQASRFVKNTLDVLEKRQARSYKVIQAAMGSDAGAAEPAAPKQQAGSVPKVATASASSVPKEASKTPSAAPPARANSLKKLPSSSSAAAPAKLGKSASSKAVTASSDTIALTPQEAEFQLENLDLDGWTTAVVPNFQSAKWTDRKAAFEALEGAFQLVSSDVPTANLDAVVVYVAAQSKNFKESNVQVLKSAFQAVTTIAGLCDSMGAGVVSYVVPPAVEKMGDRKVSETVRPMFMTFGELVGPAAVLTAMFGHMAVVKTPLAQLECLEFVNECVKEFGVTVCNPRGIIEYAKGPFGMESSNPKSRVSAIALFGTLYNQLGDGMRPLLNLDAWKPSLKDTVEAEFKRVGYTANAFRATRAVKCDEGAGGGGAASGGGSLFGRVDISAKITKELLADMQNEDDKVAWKKRLDAMEQAQRLCEEAGLSIELTKAVMDLMKSLKARLSDSNANLKTKAVQVIGVVATSIGPSVSKLAKLVGNNLVVGVSDNKKAMQQACLEALHKWVVHNDVASGSCFDSLLPFVAEALKNPVGRAELLGWTVAMTQLISDRLDLRPLVENTIDALLDKSTEAREKAQLLLVDVFKSVGKDAVHAGCRDILPAKMRTLKPMIDRAATAAFGSGTAVDDKPASAKPATSSLARASSTVGGARTPASAPSPKAMTSIPRSLSTASTSSSASAPPAAPATSLLISSDKLSRLERNRKNKWIFDPADPAELLARKGQVETEWSALVHSTLRAKLFAPSYEKGMMQAIDDLSACVTAQPDEVFESLDLILKWSTLRIVDNNVQALVKMLDLLVKLFQMLVNYGWELDDVEAAIFLPYLCQESGQQKPRFRMRFRDVLRLVVQVYPSAKLTPYLLDCITNSKNSKSRSECLDLIEYIAETKGHAAVGRKTLRDIAKYVDCSEKEVRESAIAAVVRIFTLVGDANTDRFFTLCNISSQKSMDLVLQKIKYLPTAASIPSGPKPTVPSSYQRYASAPVDEPAREPPLSTTHDQSAKTSRFERPVTPIKVHTPSSAHPPGYAQPPPTTLLQRPATPAKYQPSSTSQHDGTRQVDMPLSHTPSAVPFRSDLGVTPVAATTTRTDMRTVLFLPLERLLVSQRELTVNLDAFAAGKDALKSIYFVASSGDDLFMQENVNEVVLRVCHVLHAAFGKPNMELNVVSLCVATVANILKHAAYASRIERIAIERLLLEACMGFLDPRLDDIEATLSNRIMVALNKLIMTTAYALRIGEVWPAMLVVLERLVSGKVDEYKIHDKVNLLTDKPTLARVVAKLVVKTTRRELALPTPFANVDVASVLHTKHRFFTTCAVLASDANDDGVWANNAMKTSLKHAADFWGASEDRRPAFQAALNDLPISSPIHRMLMQIAPNVFTIPSPDAAARGLTNAVQLFSTTTDPATKLQAAMTMVEVKMNSDAAAMDVDASKKDDLRQSLEKLDMAAYNRTAASATDSAIKCALTRTNIFKDRSLEVSAAPTASSGDQPPKSMALMDLKQRLARIQMH
ncbi:hypothetical protein H310_04156 [Aphanomyces invadans]|uniref:TOG domain-containing protein n=1 Tax=Aphanomyces invadans TaxID=157072 RepID=A0A024UFT9_9STRA|nr:hypothetical protein H310_04156 [Aphanomyces invadans]ETW05149.1 hypothetical protein H310_04156 [Aphanomyces invadans]|eukprot:XP_008866587.1 hypothetical protein H310_04156 [Aphanomyces invadans]